MDIREEKRLLRRQVRERLKEIAPEEWRRIGDAVCQRLLRSPEYRAAEGVFCFVGFGAEVDTRPFLRRVPADGKRLYVPRCRPGGEMDAVEIGAEGDLSERGPFGIPEPPVSCPAAKIEEIDLAVVPCLAADAQGGRLGRGGGYYDRFLARFGGMTVLLCPDEAVLPAVPREEWDQKCARLITQSRG